MAPEIVYLKVEFTQSKMKNLFFKFFWFAAFAFAMTSNVLAQYNIATGFTNTAIVNGACYRLTDQSQSSATGVIWSNSSLDLTCNFVRAFNVKFGNSDGGADGMAFIMKNVANYAPAAGSNGGSLAFDWVGNTNSFMIEFDTYNNSLNPSYDPTTSAQGANPDHMAFLRNGSVNHNSANNLAGPLATSNLENGAYHNVTISWIAATNTLTCVIDNNWTLTSVVNLSTILGSTTTYFGWAGTTGGLTNLQEVCPLPNPPIVLPAETVNICPNANTPLDASIIDITNTTLVGNGSKGSVSYTVVENKFGTFAKLKALLVTDLIEYQKAGGNPFNKNVVVGTVVNKDTVAHKQESSNRDAPIVDEDDDLPF